MSHGQSAGNRVEFSNRPLDVDPTSKYRIIRTPANGRMQMTILDVDAVGCYTHFWRNRTRPHTKPYCEACEGKSPVRWHGYLGVQGLKSQDVAIFEFTGACCDTLDEFLRLHQSLRGALCTAYRIGNRANSRVALRLQKQDIPLLAVPPAPDVVGFLERMWDLPPGSMERGNPNPITCEEPILSQSPGLNNRIRKHTTNGQANRE